MKTSPFGFSSPIRTSVAIAGGLWLSQLALTLSAAPPASWPQRQRDTENTGRADFAVPSSRLNTNFFNAIRWQKPSPNSPDEGNFGSSAMVFFDGAGPGGADLVAGGYHWPKGIQGMDRHTGALFWTGNPEGGESIGDNTPAFSTIGATIYVIGDATAHPLMAFAATNGPGSYWFADTDDGRNKLSAFSPKVAADGRIFAHAWNDRPYAGTDSGTAISLSWSAASDLCDCYNCPAFWADTNRLLVVSGGRCGMIKAWDGASGTELWSVAAPSLSEADATIDPATGNIYLPLGVDNIWIAGLDKHGNALWSQPALTVFQWQNGVNNPQRAQSAGCLSHDGQTYYFQTVSQQGDGQLYAIRTADGSVKWSFNTGSKGWENQSSSPIVTSNGVLVIGNNDGGTYFALRDAGTNAVLLASLMMATNSYMGFNGAARSSATLSPDGLLYLPVRVTWTQSNGDGDSPTQLPANVFTAFDLNANVRTPAAWPQRQRDTVNTGRADFAVPSSRLNTNFFNAIRWQKPSPNSPDEGNFGSSAMVFFDGAGPGGADLVAGGYHWPKGIQGMDRHTGARFWTGNPEGGESIGDNTPAFSTSGATVYVMGDATAHPLMAFAARSGPGTYWFADTDDGRNKLSAFSPKVAGDGRIFAHAWDDRPYAGTDSGAAISLSWSAASGLCDCLNCPALWADTNRLLIISSGRCGMVKAWDGASGSELWSVGVPSQNDADATIDPATGNIYLPLGADSIWIAGLDKNGSALWSQPALTVFQWENGVNNPQHALSAGCLSHDGQTYYFQTVSQQGDGQLYAIRTADGSVKWSFNTGSKGWDNQSSSPIVTSNGVLVVGNNDGGTYFALRDAGTNAVMLASLVMATNSYMGANGAARSSATLSPDGLLYLPVRITWTQSNGDGDSPTQLHANVFTAFDLNENPSITVPAPSTQRGRPLNAAVALQWTPISHAFGAVFGHYAVYRATNSFTSMAGLVPIATVSDLNATGFLDATAMNGLGYFYYVTAVSISGNEVLTAKSVGPFRPYDETDLQVLSLARTPRFPRYAAEYAYYETNEPSGFGPYGFSAATGLGQGQTADTPRWPTNGQPVTYTATVRNRGSNPWLGVIHAAWRWDGQVMNSPTVAGPVPPDGLATFALTRPWDGLRHAVQFALTDNDARTNNNSRTLDTKSVAFLSYVDQTYYENFRATSFGDTNAVTDDFFDWVNRHTDRMNQMFADANCPKRIHLDVLEMLADNAPDPAIDTIYFAVFPFRYPAGDGSLRQYSGYYYPPDDIDYGLLHEMGHQLGLIDLYQMDVGADLNLVSHQGYSTGNDLMRGVSHFFSPHSALAMTHWEDQAHGYFGQYLYGLPAQINLRFLGLDGQPLVGATVKMYQYCYRPGVGQVISTQIKAQGITDTNGVWTLPNVPLDHSLAPPLPTGDTLKDNPFGYVAVVGNNGVLHFRVEQNGFTDYVWLDITEPNVAYYQGQTNSATFTRNVALGGPVQFFPPPELSEAYAGVWSCWADGSAPGNTWTTNDAQRVLVGTNSLKFVTDGGFDTYVRYPGAGLARWDLTAAQSLHVSFYAENSNGAFQSGSPWIRLKDPDGNYFQYQYYSDGGPVDILNDAIGHWQSYVIPLNASATEANGWRRTTFGTPDLGRIASLEIHMDTWGNSFIVWLDGVSFEPTPGPLRLAAKPQAAWLLLSWPALPSDYVLQSAPEAFGPYAPQPGTLTETNGTLFLRVPMSEQRRFFRLKKN